MSNTGCFETLPIQDAGRNTSALEPWTATIGYSVLAIEDISDTTLHPKAAWCFKCTTEAQYEFHKFVNALTKARRSLLEFEDTTFECGCSNLTRVKEAVSRMLP